VWPYHVETAKDPVPEVQQEVVLETHTEAPEVKPYTLSEEKDEEKVETRIETKVVREENNVVVASVNEATLKETAVETESVSEQK
jgi:hypothetical protein